MMENKKCQGQVSDIRDANVGGANVRVASAQDAGSCFKNPPRKSLANEPKYGIKQSCEKMGIGETTLRSIIHKRGIPVVNIGGKYLLLEKDIEKYLQEHYGTINETKVEPHRLPSLPANIASSDLIRKVG